jgi:excisionase family DNA binding protein
MFNVKEASEKLGLSQRQVRYLLKKGDIKGLKLGRDWVVLSLDFGMSSVKEASEKLKISPSQVRRLLATGKIKGNKLARDWVVLSLDYKRKRKPGASEKSGQEIKVAG